MTHLLVVFLPKAVLSNSFCSKSKDQFWGNSPSSSPPKIASLKRIFLCFLAVLGAGGTCPRTSPFIQNPLLFSTKILLYSFVIPPPLNSSLLVCYFIGYGSKDETSPKEEINPRAWGNCPKEKACSVFHYSWSSFSTCSRSLSILHKPQCKSSFW